MAFGGGNEIAMCRTAPRAQRDSPWRLPSPRRSSASCPAPAHAATAAPRRRQKAAELLRTGRVISGPGGGVRTGSRSSRGRPGGDRRAAGPRGGPRRGRPDTIDPRPPPTPDRLPSVDLGDLSRSTDALICRAIIEGMPPAARRGAAAGVRAVRRMLRDGRHAHWHRQLHCQRSAFGGEVRAR